jgi:DNA-binding NtrC family response regulator
VRELRNAIERAVVLAEPPADEQLEPTKPRSALVLEIDLDVPFKRAKAELVSQFERRYLKALLEETSGNVSRAARRAGLDRMSEHKILTRLGLSK